MRLGVFIFSLIFCIPCCWAEESQHVRELVDEDSHRVLAKLSYCECDIKARVLYRYNEHGLMIETIIDDGISEDPVSVQGVTERLITLYVHPANAIDDEHPVEVIEKFHDLRTGEVKIIKHVVNTYVNGIQLIKRIVMDGLGNATETTFDGSGRIASLLEKKADGSSQLSTFTWDTTGKLEQTTQQKDIMPSYSQSDASEKDQAIQASRDYYQRLYSRLMDLLNRLSFSNSQKTTLDKMRHDFESIADFILGPDIFQFTGYYTYPAAQDIYGQGEIHNKVRITAINGLFNTPEDRLFNLKLLSKLHGGCNIHYIARSYEGWSRDMIQAILSKMGFLSHQSYALASTWKKLIAEMGGIYGGGTIIHYAHSVGGSETNNAKILMTPEELKMIKVYTFGSPTVVPIGEFQSAVNYCSMDPICVLDLVSLIKAYFDSSSHVVFLPVSSPAHELASQAYVTTLEKLGAEFVETYIKTRDHTPTFVID